MLLKASEALKITEEMLYVGLRETLKKARELSGYQQTDCFNLFGYKGSYGIAKLESGQTKPTLLKIVQASLVYGVSTDFLLKLSADPDRDPRSLETLAVARSARHATERGVNQLLRGIVEYGIKNTPVRAHLENMIAAANLVLQAALQSNHEPTKQAALALADAADDARRFLRTGSSVAHICEDFPDEALTYPLFEDLKHGTPRNS